MIFQNKLRFIERYMCISWPFVSMENMVITQSLESVREKKNLLIFQ